MNYKETNNMRESFVMSTIFQGAWDGAYGMRRRASGIDDGPREEGLFDSLSPPISGKTVVTRELYYIWLPRCPSRTPTGLGRSTPRFGGSGPCTVKVYYFFIPDTWV
jgi:hypothetical protein